MRRMALKGRPIQNINPAHNAIDPKPYSSVQGVCRLCSGSKKTKPYYKNLEKFSHGELPPALHRLFVVIDFGHGTFHGLGFAFVDVGRWLVGKLLER